jgi:hypothetical protein
VGLNFGTPGSERARDDPDPMDEQLSGEYVVPSCVTKSHVILVTSDHSINCLSVIGHSPIRVVASTPPPRCGGLTGCGDTKKAGRRGLPRGALAVIGKPAPSVAEGGPAAVDSTGIRLLGRREGSGPGNRGRGRPIRSSVVFKPHARACRRRAGPTSRFCNDRVERARRLHTGANGSKKTALKSRWHSLTAVTPTHPAPSRPASPGGTCKPAAPSNNPPRMERLCTAGTPPREWLARSAATSHPRCSVQPT